MGQFSYLPLQWIELHDIQESLDSKYICSAYEIDRRSLGGSRKNAVSEVQELFEISPSLRECMRRLEQFPVDRRTRVAAFCRDLHASLPTLLDALKSGAYMIITIGNRSVGGRHVPTDKILTEFLTCKNVSLVTKIERIIPSKRMATRNTVSRTMSKEAILVFRKK